MPHTDTIPVSASIASTGKSIRYIGDHAYAYSGLLEVSADIVTVLEFTTGSGYLVGEFQVNAGYDDDNAAGAATPTVANISFNGLSIGIIGCGGQTPDRRPSSITQKVVIPPNTEVVGTLDSSATADHFYSLTFVGRVYGAE